MENMPNIPLDNDVEGENSWSNPENLDVLPQELREQASEILHSDDPEFLESEDVQHAIGAIEEYDSNFAQELEKHVENFLNNQVSANTEAVSMNNPEDLNDSLSKEDQNSSTELNKKAN